MHIFALYSPILFLCGTSPNPGSATSAIRCKGCSETIPARVGTMPDSLDCCSLPVVWGKEALPTYRDFPGSTVTQISWWAESQGGALMGEMKRAIAREEQDRKTQDRFASTIVIAASIIAAVRLAREPDISRPSPRLTSVVADSVSLARMIFERVVH